LDQLVKVNNITVLATGIEVESLVVKTADVGTVMKSPNDVPYDQSTHQPIYYFVWRPQPKGETKGGLGRTSLASALSMFVDDGKM
jgi:hypothetical protein